MKISAFPVILLFAITAISSPAWSQANVSNENSSLQFIRILETDDYFESLNLDGIAFPPYANTVLRVKGKSEGSATLEVVERGKKPGNPNNQVLQNISALLLTYDVASDDLYNLDVASNQLDLVKTRDDTNQIGSAKRGRGRASLGRHKLKNVRGIAKDGNNGIVFVLDKGGKRLVSLIPSNSVVTTTQVNKLNKASAKKVTLKTRGRVKLKGLAFNKLDGYLYSVNVRTRELVKINPNGNGRVEVVGTFNAEQWDEPVAMVFAASLDQTDAPERVHLFIAGEADTAGRVTEWYLSNTASSMQ